MEAIKSKLVTIGIENYEAKFYIPFAELDKFLDAEIVRKAIIESGLELPEQDEVIQTVLSGGKRLFAILVEIRCLPAIVKIIERDHLQDQPLDAKLPLDESYMVALLGESDGKSFYRKQWNFMAPLFRGDLSHRILDRATILPFSDNRRIGQGAFGTVYEVVIDARHQAGTAGAYMSSVSQGIHGAI